MSRALNLKMSEAQVVKHCRDGDISISALEVLPDGGVRLVCSSGSDAEKVRAKLHRHVMSGPARRAAFRPTHPLW